jgi:uncharacterized Zn-finger protein
MFRDTLNSSNKDVYYSIKKSQLNSNLHTKNDSDTVSGSKSTLYTCKQCMKSFRIKKSLKRHLIHHNEHRPFICTYCNFRLKDIETFRTHHNTQHPNLKCIEKTIDRPKPFECSKCKKKYKTFLFLTQHLPI